MVALATLERLAALEVEMAHAGRSAEEAALRDARRALARQHEVLTTGEAAERLRISIPTVERWIGRGTLVGSAIGSRWLVSAQSVERILRLRAALADLDAEGNPTPGEIL